MIQLYMLWFSFILGLNFIFVFQKSLSYVTIFQNKGDNFEPRIELSHNPVIASKCFLGLAMSNKFIGSERRSLRYQSISTACFLFDD